MSYVTQLNPTIPIVIAKNPYGIPEGEATAILFNPMSEEHDNVWTCWHWDTGQLWDVRQPYLRMMVNRTLGRLNEITSHI